MVGNLAVERRVIASIYRYVTEWKPSMFGTASDRRTRERPLEAERDQFRADAAAAHDRLGMALSLVSQIQADAEKERARLIAEIETQRQETARDQVAAQAEHDRLVWDALQARQEVQAAKERADGITDRLTTLERTLEASQAERDRLRAEVEQARRPWWRRLIG
jgi:hypothetical protein